MAAAAPGMAIVGLVFVLWGMDGALVPAPISEREIAVLTAHPEFDSAARNAAERLVAD